MDVSATANIAPAEASIESNLANGNAALEACNYSQAVLHFEAVLAQACNGSISLNRYLDCLNKLTTACVEESNFFRAEQVSKLALSTVQKQMGAKHHMVGDQLNQLAHVRLRQGRLKEAEQLLLESIEIIEKFYEAFHPALLKPLESLSRVYQEQQQAPKAVQSLERAIAIRTACFGEDDPGIKFFKNICREIQGGARKGQKKAKPAVTADPGVQLSLFG